MSDTRIKALPPVEGDVDDVSALSTEEMKRADAQLKKTQAFFNQLALEARQPHFGDFAKQFTASLLKRAQEAGLYTPPQD